MWRTPLICCLLVLFCWMMEGRTNKLETKRRRKKKKGDEKRGIKRGVKTTLNGYFLEVVKMPSNGPFFYQVYNYTILRV